MIKPGDFSKYAANKEAFLGQLGKSFLKGISGKAGRGGVEMGAKMLGSFGRGMARKGGRAAGWAMKNPGTAGALGVGGLWAANRMTQPQQPQFQMRY